MSEPQDSLSPFISGQMPMPDLFGPTPGPGESANGPNAAEAERARRGPAWRNADTARRARKHTDGLQTARPARRGAAESRSNPRTATDGAAAAGSARGGYRFAGARLPTPAHAMAAIALVVAALAAIALHRTNDAPKRAPGPEPQPPADSAVERTRDRGREPRRPSVPSPPAGLARERSKLTRPRRGRKQHHGKKAPARARRSAPSAPPAVVPPAAPPAVVPPAQSFKDMAPPPAPGPSKPAPPARRAPALPAPVPPGSPPEFL
jgi:hypothetical protein